MSSTAWTFGKSAQRSAIAKQGVPGPGNYETQSKFGSVKLRAQSAGRQRPSERQHFQGKTTSSLKDLVPGPGQYFKETENKKNTQGITFGIKTTANSFMSMGDGTPGPGQYDFQKATMVRPRTAGGIIGERTKSCIDKRPSTTNNVGPGAYDLDVSILNESHSRARNTGFSSQQRSTLGQGKDTPGPGAYCSLKEAYSYNSHRFGSSTR